MKYEEIEPRIDELEEVSKTVAGTLEKAKVELSEAQIEMRFVKQLVEIEGFVSGLMNAARDSMSQEEALRSLIGGLNKIQEYVRAESQRVRERVPAMKERVAVLESLQGFMGDRKRSHVARKEAIERVAADESDTKRPERISTVREAEKLRKARKQDDT
jgi:hypothetical protein